MKKLTYQELCSEIWQAADILGVTSKLADRRGYIFGLLFLKRISDVFEEERKRIEEETGIRDLAWSDPDEHQFFVPERAKWDNISGVSIQVGDELNKACAELEDANPVIRGILATIDFNSDKLGDAKQRDSTLKKLIQHFSKISMRESDLAKPDIVGRVCDFLVEKFADEAGKKGGELFTPREVVQLLVFLLDAEEGMRVFDPIVGSGTTLVESANYVGRKGGNPKNLTLCGQEKDIATWGICKMNLILHGFPDADIRKGDVIRDPKFFIERKLMFFDREISNLHFTPDKWGREIAQLDGLGRFSYGIPPKTKGNFAFIEHMISTLKDQGKMAVVVPHGVLFRGGAEGKIRENILKEDLVEAVVGLPSALFYGTGMSAAVLVINKKKSQERKGAILFIDASQEYQKGKKRNTLRDRDIERIVDVYRGFENVKKYCRVVSLAEIEENDYNLNISRYVDVIPEVEPIDVDAELSELRSIESRRRKIEADMMGYLKELGYET